mmetsp:Transcript_30669/g.105400  ORF Transcript_30669/g.105400 Transcript_30669/m.105400 type:complete len:240 (-) Transcript_30669:294-1013(-)
MSSDGECGRKSLPTKNVMKTKSSTRRSKSSASTRCAPDSAPRSTQNSSWMYSRKMEMCSSSKSADLDCFRTVERTFFGAPRFRLFALKSMTSRSSVNRGSCVASASMMRSASLPYMQWRVGSAIKARSGAVSRMYCMILCSPSPGTSAPEKMTVSRSAQAPSPSLSLRLMKRRSCSPTRIIKSVPGVMQFESKATSSASRASPRAAASRRSSPRCCAAPNRRDRCWFSLARGATPSTAT